MKKDRRSGLKEKIKIRPKRNSKDLFVLKSIYALRPIVLED